MCLVPIFVSSFQFFFFWLLTFVINMAFSSRWKGTCRPYLVHAIEECAKTAQKGGVGVIAYFRKEGRALGEVTK
jgi:hypothetical protein